MIAKKLIHAAKKCGADAIKFQSFNPDKVVTKKLKLAIIKKSRPKSKSMLEMIKNLINSKRSFQVIENRKK